MKNSFVLDTSFVSAVISKSDTHTKIARKIIQSHQNEVKYVVPIMVVFEVLSTPNNPTILRFLEEFLNRSKAEIVYFDKTFKDNYTKFMKQILFSIKAPDSTILFTAVHFEAELLTFDEKLVRAYKQMVV